MKNLHKFSLLALFGLVLSACGPSSAPTTAAPTETPTEAPTTVAPTETPTEAPTSEPPVFVPPESISLIGSMEESNWTNDIDFVDVDDGHMWTLAEYTFDEGDEWKIRMNHNWGTVGIDNWGYSYLDDASKTLFSGTDNIIVETAGKYGISFDYDELLITAVYLGEAEEPIVHQDPFVSSLPEGSVTRAYDEEFDLLLNDSSTETTTAVTQGTAIYTNKSTLRAIVDSNHDSFPNTPDRAIYKMATGSTEIETYEGIGFRMRKVGDGALDYSNLKLGLRGNDAWKVYEIPLADAVNPDGDPLPELTDEYQDITICPNLSIEDGDTEYELIDSGEPSGTKVLSEILGIHLMAMGECSQVIEIEEVYVTNPGDRKTLDNFNRKEVGKTDDTCWWRDSTGFIVQPNTTIHTDGFYMPGTPAFYSEWENLVFNIMGDTSVTGLYFFDAAGNALSIKTWQVLKDPNGNAVPEAVNGAFHPIVINFEQSGIDTTNVVAVSVGSISKVSINSTYLTNMQTEAAIEEYPRIDTLTRYTFDGFNRNVTKIASTYEDGNSEVDPVIAEAGLYYSIAYNNADLTSVDGDALVLKPTDGYIQVTEGSTVGRNGAKYMVFVMAVEDGDLSGFRVGSSTGGVKWMHEWLAGPGLASNPESLAAYPYVDMSGYAHYIMDIEATGWDVSDAMDIYYTGTGTLKIDEIYFTNDYEQLAAYSTGGATGEIAIGADYKYSYGGYLIQDTRQVGIMFTGDGVVNLESMRVEYNGSTIWAKDNLVLLDGITGAAYDYKAAIPAEGAAVIIDMVASGFDISKADHMHLHFGQVETAPAGTLNIVMIQARAKVTYPTVLLSNTPVTTDFSSGYAWGGQTIVTGEEIAVIVKIVGDGTATLGSLRIEYNGLTVWLKDTNYVTDYATGEAVDLSAPIPTSGAYYMFNFLVGGFSTSGSLGYMHMHWGGLEGVTGGSVTVSEVIGVYMQMPYVLLISSYVE